MKSILQYLLNLAIALDKMGNALLLGHPDESISRRCARAENAGIWGFRHICQVLDKLIGPHHCYISDEPGTKGKEILHWSKNFTLPILTVGPGGDIVPPQGSV